MSPLTRTSGPDSGGKAAPERDDFAPPPEIDGARIRRRVILLAAIVLAVVAVITLVPGLASLRSRFVHANFAWIGLGAVLKILSGVAYVMVFRGVFCRKMRWRVSMEIGFAELGANAVLPVGGAGGLALGAWALRRAGMDVGRIARRSVAFFFLTSVPNVVGVIILGVGFAVGIFGAHVGLALGIVPATVSAGAIVVTIAGGRWAGAAERRLGDRSRRLAAVLRALSGGVDEALVLLRERDALLLAGLLGYLVFDMLVMWTTFHAFGASPALALIFMGYLIGELGGLIPVPGGIGGVELGLVGALVLYGIPVGASVAAVAGYRAIALVVPGVLGVVAFAMLRRSLAREAIAISECAPGGTVDVIGRGEVQVSR